jgi:tetratricopeptide (TPR) repeat protein
VRPSGNLARTLPPALLLLAFGGVSPAALAPLAQESAPADAAEEVPSPEEGEALLARGDYERSLSSFDRILARGGSERALAGKARALLSLGRYEAAGEALERTPSSPLTRRLLGDARAATGRLEEAEKAYRAAVEEPSDLSGREALASFLEATGRRSEAVELRQGIARSAARDPVEDPEGLLALGRVYAALGREEEASEVFAELLREDPDRADVAVALGDLYFRVYRDTAGYPSAVEEYQQALRRNPRHLGALLGCFRVYRSNFARDGSKTDGFLRKALDVNPRDVEALVEQASYRVQDRRFEEARASLGAALRVHPRHRGARARLASLDLLEGRRREWEETARALAGEDPTSGEPAATAGSDLVELYRFAEAVPLLREAVRVEPSHGGAWTDLGRALANSGREAEAAEALRRAEEAERGYVHPWRKNMLAVLDRLERAYVWVESPPFRLRLHPDEAPVLGELLPPLLHEALEELTKRYDLRPEGEILVEVFHEYGDFSVRTVGFTGFGALGVCFGPVVTTVSPLAPEVRGKFSWEATAWHEFAHVLTIALSRGRVPRWLTEGLSVLEEKRRDPAFDRGMDLELLNARASGAIVPIEELNGVFRTPNILFGYYQGGLVCEWLERGHPFEQLRKMLRLYGEDRSTREILRECFGLTPEEFDRRLLAFIDEKLRDVRVEPTRSEEGLRRLRARVKEAPDDLDAIVSLAWEQARRRNTVDAEEGLRRVRARAPDHPRAHLLAGELAYARGRTDVARAEYEAGFARGAEEFFARAHHAKILEGEKEFEAAIQAWRAAKAAFPRFAADPDLSPHLALRRLLAGAGRAEEARRELEEFAGLGVKSVDPFLDLATYAEGRADAADAEKWLRKALGVDPFRRDLHARRGRSLRTLGALDEAVAAFRVARAVRPDLEPNAPREGKKEAEETHERAELFREEAETHLLRSDRASAAEAARRALELDPEDRRATEILELAGRPSSG